MKRKETMHDKSKYTDEADRQLYSAKILFIIGKYIPTIFLIFNNNNQRLIKLLL